MYLQQEVNIKIGAKAPIEYINDVFAQCETGKPVYGAITDKSQLIENLKTSCLPVDIENYNYANYESFLADRRILMAKKIKQYYESL